MAKVQWSYFAVPKHRKSVSAEDKRLMVENSNYFRISVICCVNNVC